MLAKFGNFVRESFVRVEMVQGWKFENGKSLRRCIASMVSTGNDDISLDSTRGYQIVWYGLWSSGISRLLSSFSISRVLSFISRTVIVDEYIEITFESV